MKRNKMKKLLTLSTALLLSATVLSAEEVTLKLGKQSVDADGYRLYYDTNPDNKRYAIDFGTLLEYTVPGLECGTTYYFTIKGYNEAGESVPTNDVIVTTDVCPQLPTIPEGWTIDSLVLKPVQEN